MFKTENPQRVIFTKKEGERMLKIRIETKNVAFKDDLEGELHYCLSEIRRRIKEGLRDCPVHDRNGNRVGEFRLTDR